MRKKTLIIGIALSALLLALASVGGRTTEHRRLIVTGSSTLAPLIAEIGLRFEAGYPDVRVDVQTGGSSRGIADARSGVADLGMISRDLKSGEDGLLVYRIATDGIAMIVHASNPVRSLSKDNIVAIYTGMARNWAQVGGHEHPVVVVHKAEGRGTLEVFLDYFQLRNSTIKPDLIVGENQQAIKTVAGDPNAIGYVSIGAAEFESRHGTSIRLLETGDVSPTLRNVLAGRFPMTRPLSLISNGTATGDAEAFVKFAASQDVHDLITTHLFVPFNG